MWFKVLKVNIINQFSAYTRDKFLDVIDGGHISQSMWDDWYHQCVLLFAVNNDIIDNATKKSGSLKRLYEGGNNTAQIAGATQQQRRRRTMKGIVWPSSRDFFPAKKNFSGTGLISDDYNGILGEIYFNYSERHGSSKPRKKTPDSIWSKE